MCVSKTNTPVFYAITPFLFIPVRASPSFVRGADWVIKLAIVYICIYVCVFLRQTRPFLT